MISNSLPLFIYLSNPLRGNMQMLPNSNFLIDLWSRDQASDGSRANSTVSLPKMAASSEILLLKCANFRDEGQFIDVRLKVSDGVFTAHRIVLAASSDYFYAMFTNGMKESSQ